MQFSLFFCRCKAIKRVLFLIKQINILLSYLRTDAFCRLQSKAPHLFKKIEKNPPKKGTPVNKLGSLPPPKKNTHQKKKITRGIYSKLFLRK